MVTFVYACDKCGNEFETKQDRHAKPLKKCKACGKHGLYRVPQIPMVSIRLSKSEIKTIGHLAERNTKTMGKYEKDSLDEKDVVLQRKKKAKENAPWWRPGTTGVDKKIRKMTKEQKENYIKNGN